MTTFQGTFLPRRGTAAQWTTSNRVLEEGERGVEADTDREKVGDGVTAWNDLAYDLGKGRDPSAAGVTFQPVGTIAATNVQDAIVEVAAEAGGGGGAVDSVNGQTGAVTLNAGDVGADVAGSSSGVQSNLTAHQGVLGLGAHVPSGGTDGQVLTKGVGTDVAWEDAAAGGGAVDSVNGQTGVVVLGAADVSADPAGTATGAVAGHADDYGAGFHLPAGGTAGQVPVKGAGTAVAWADPTAPSTHAQAVRVVWNPAGAGAWQAVGEPPDTWDVADFVGPAFPLEADNGVGTFWPLRDWDTFTEVGI